MITVAVARSSCDDYVLPAPAYVDDVMFVFVFEAKGNAIGQWHIPSDSLGQKLGKV